MRATRPPRPRASRRSLATSAALALLCLAAIASPTPSFSEAPAEASAAVIRLGPAGLTSRIATDQLACDVPGFGNHCIVTNCPSCTGAIPDGGELSRTLTITQAQLDALELGFCRVNRVKVAIELTHSFPGNLQIELAHGPTEVLLYRPDVGCEGTG